MPVRRVFRIALVAAVACIAAADALAQSVSEMGAKSAGEFGIQVDDQLVNASRALEEAWKAYRTGGESTRGGSGTIASLLVESDKLICNSWLIGYSDVMRDMAVSGGFQTDAGTEVIQRLNHMKSLIERACEDALNGKTRIGVIGGAGEVTPDLACPECEPARLAYEDAKTQHALAEFRLYRANADANFINDMFEKNPAAARRIFTIGPAAAQDRVQEFIEKWKATKAAMEAAHTAWLQCVEDCHKKLRSQFGFFSDPKRTTLVAAAAVAATTLLVAGGGDAPPAVAAAPPLAPAPAPAGVTTTPDPQPVVTLLSLVLGTWVCDACRILSDIDRHENTLRFCAQLVALFQLTANSPMRIGHPAPWIPPTGELDEGSGAYRGQGIGPLGSFANVSSTVAGTFQRTGNSVSTVDLTVTLGENGALPGGRPVSYVVRLRKTP